MVFIKKTILYFSIFIAYKVILLYFFHSINRTTIKRMKKTLLFVYQITKTPCKSKHDIMKLVLVLLEKIKINRLAFYF